MGSLKLIRVGKGSGVPGSGAFMFPPRPDVCQECATKHEPEMPHDRQSMFFQYAFANKHGRWPTWKDAMSHCTLEMQKLWQDGLLKLGVWSETKESMTPEDRTAHRLMGSDLPSGKPTMEPGNIMKVKITKIKPRRRRR